jgi:acetyl-CoA carboxylase, biotin carboxylase subunit
MIRRVLIANRGEIAVRVIRACREMGIETVAVYSQADTESMHVEHADTAVCIGPPPGRRSYLDMSSVVAAALGTGADAIHPGYGFLAENAEFAALCASEGVIFIGPSPHAIRAVGDKLIARETVAKAGVPVVGGTKDAISDPAEAAEMARSIGMPVLLKARGGGGGRGMRVVEDAAGVASAFLDASREAEAAFGDGGMYMERYLDAVKHVEIQILADQHGTFVALGERDCSTQRRHQKLIEESPSPGLDPQVRAQMCEAAINAARSVDYFGAGTVEFLYSPKTREFFFIEMNARIQVEHPVTEMVTGIDIVKEQLSVAAGGKLSIASSVPLSGHAIECRINAEDPAQNFMPSPGVLTRYAPPSGPGVRVDSHAYEGYRFPPNYDSLLAKLIVHGKDREESRTRMMRALNDYVIEGIKTTIPFHVAMLEHPEFRAGNITTQFVGKQVSA